MGVMQGAMGDMSGGMGGLGASGGMGEMNGGMGSGGMSGGADLGALGALGAMAGGNADNLGKAIGAAAQMGLIPNGTNGGGGLSLPKFGNQRGAMRPQQQQQMPMRQSGGGSGINMNNLPGARIVNRAANQAAARAMGRLINRGLRF